jgi:hypothetical protein
MQEGERSTYQSDCRSRDGYEWSGSVEYREWEEGGLARETYNFDISVAADVEDPAFTALSIAGSVARAVVDEVEHVDVDLELALVGYFESQGESNDPRLAAWADWRASGSIEVENATIRSQVHANVAGSGAVPIVGKLSIDAGCSIEPEGDLSLDDTTAARFQGADACDACAEITQDETMVSEACAP